MDGVVVVVVVVVDRLVVVVVFAVASFAVVVSIIYHPCRSVTFRMVLQAQGRSQFIAVEVADRLFVSDTSNNRDFIVSNVPSQAVPINMTAHDGQHKAIIASIVVEPGPSSSAGPRIDDEESRMKGARDVMACARERTVAEHEAVSEEAAALTAQMAERVRDEEEAALAEDRCRAEQERILNLREAERRQAEEEKVRVRRLAEEEEARARRLAEEEEVRARRLAEEEEAARAVIEGRRREDEVAAERRRTAMLDAKKRDELEAERRRAAMESENRAVAERRRAAILDEEKRMAALKLRLEEQAAQDRQQPEMQPEEAEEEMEEAHRTGVLTNNALATHLWPRPRLRSIPISSPHGPHLVQTLSRFPPGTHVVPNWFLIGSHPRFTLGSHLCGGGHVGTRWSQVGTWWDRRVGNGL